jgi:hypothetical protein
MVCDSGAPMNVIRMKGAALLCAKHFFHAPIADAPAKPAPMDEPTAANPSAAAPPALPNATIVSASMFLSSIPGVAALFSKLVPRSYAATPGFAKGR